VRDEITKYLGTVMQSSADTLAKKLCLDRLSVARELHAMAQEGVIEREMKKGEYLYWLTRKDAPAASKDGIDMHPKTLPAGVTTVPKTPPVEAVKPEEAPAPKVSTEEKVIPLIYELLTVLGLPKPLAAAIERAKKMVADREDEAKAFSGLLAQMTDLKTELENVARLQEDTRAECEGLRADNGALTKAIEEWKSKSEMLQQQIEQHEERQRFNALFGSRPESVREAMWESWLERSKLVEVAA
jgi:hypothetical protein